MIHNISWASYCYAIVVLFAFYYLIVAFYYYKGEIGQVLTGKRLLFRMPKRDNILNPIPEKAIPKNILNQIPLVQSLIDEVRALCKQSSYSKLSKVDLVLALSTLLKKYISLKDSEYGEEVSSVVRSELEERCSIQISESELDVLWMC